MRRSVATRRRYSVSRIKFLACTAVHPAPFRLRRFINVSLLFPIRRANRSRSTIHITRHRHSTRQYTASRFSHISIRVGSRCMRGSRRSHLHRRCHRSQMYRSCMSHRSSMLMPMRCKTLYICSTRPCRHATSRTLPIRISPACRECMNRAYSTLSS